MKQFALAAVLSLGPVLAWGQTANPVVQDILSAHILPRFEALSAQSQALADAATTDCTPTSATLRSAYGDAFDAWVSASHLRFGPTETNERAFALAFWPDARGATPRALATLIADQDPIADTAADYADVTIAARGFYALELMLYDDALATAGDAAYRCRLVQTISADIADTSRAILTDWRETYATTLLHPAPDGVYRSDTEALQELFKALATGLQFTSDTRLGRPLGTFDRPRPTRAEARRSERSATHVALSLTALHDLAARLAADDTDLKAKLDKGFADAMARLVALNDPTFAGTADPQTRLRIEIVQQAIDTIRATVGNDLGPTLGVAAGFNSLDGD